MRDCNHWWTWRCLVQLERISLSIRRYVVTVLKNFRSIALFLMLLLLPSRRHWFEP